MKINKDGFGVIGIVAVVAVVGIVSLAGWVVVSKNSDHNKTTKASQTTTAKPAVKSSTSTKSDKLDTQISRQTEAQSSQSSSTLTTPSAAASPKNETAAPQPASPPKDEVTLDISSSAGMVPAAIDYRIAGISYSLADNAQLIFVDANGNESGSLTAFAINRSKTGSITIPAKMFACALGTTCHNQVDTAKGIGKLLFTHSNDLVIDASVPFEVK